MSLSNNIVFRVFKVWVLDNRLPGYDSKLLEDALEEARKSSPELTLEEAMVKVETCAESSDHPWVDLARGIDWDAMGVRDEAKRRGIELAEQLRDLIDAGLLDRGTLLDIANIVVGIRSPEQKHEVKLSPEDIAVLEAVDRQHTSLHVLYSGRDDGRAAAWEPCPSLAFRPGPRRLDRPAKDGLWRLGRVFDLRRNPGPI